MYTSHLEINQDNVQALLDIAQCLQVPNVQSMCNTFLKPCPPPVEIPSFSLPGMLTSEHDCLLGSGLPHDVDLHCPPEAQRSGFSSDMDNSKRLPVPVANSTSNCDAAPVEKQLVHGYKLRNFYSKQYFKQSAIQTNNATINQGPGPLVQVEEQPCQLGVSQGGGHTAICSGNTIQPNPPCAPQVPEKNPVASLTPSDNLNGPNTNTHSMLSQPVRPKKTVYLKKYNYLRSHKELEEMFAESVSEPVLSCAKRSQQDDHVVHTDASEVAIAALNTDTEATAEVMTDTQLPSPPTVNQEKQHVTAAPEPQPQPPQQQQQTVQKQYRCEVCGKICKHPSNLEMHKRSHTGNDGLGSEKCPSTMQKICNK